MGASLGLALQARGLTEEVIGCARKPATLETALRIGAVHQVTYDPRQAVSEADLVVLATPVGSILTILEQISPYLPVNTMVTDVGSVKVPIVRGAEQILSDWIGFIGGHPMCGSEESGPEAARVDLYEGAVWAITPSSRTPQWALERLIHLIQALGAHPLIVSPEEHDQAVAIVSHLPHITSSALAVCVAQLAQTIPASFQLAAGGLRDTTRIAAGDEILWHDICMANREALLEAIETLQTHLSTFKEALRSGDSITLLKLLKRGKESRQQFFP